MQKPDVKAIVPRSLEVVWVTFPSLIRLLIEMENRHRGASDVLKSVLRVQRKDATNGG